MTGLSAEVLEIHERIQRRIAARTPQAAPHVDPPPQLQPTDDDGSEWIILTRHHFRAGQGPTGGFNAKQVAIFGLKWKELQKGWIDRLVGTRILRADYERFIQLRSTAESVARKRGLI
jgi:hypothetical protein